MAHIIIAGGSGFIGQYLARHLNKQSITTHILSRTSMQRVDNIHTHKWDGQTIGPWQTLFEGALAVINLTGRSVDCRYTPPNKREILESRILATRVVAQAIAMCEQPPPVWLNASSATIYADTRGQAPANTEESTHIGDDFSMGVCKQWEACCLAQPTPYTRKVLLRMAIVLGDGSAMVPLRRLARLGLGGPMGDGEQYFSWIHIADLANIIDLAIARDDIQGVLNCASPNPVTNEVFMRTLRKEVGMPIGISSPAWLLALGARVIGTETELVLKSRKVVSQKLKDLGYLFQYPTLESAMQQLI